MSSIPTKEFDYIVVGAGSAGCAVASRLTEDSDVSVLLIEAGAKSKSTLSNMPAAMVQTTQRSELNWGFVSEPEPALNGRSLQAVRGKALGGCSQINGMIYARGDRADYDDWSKLGCQGWSYEEVLPYFKRSENNHAGESQFRGGSGPLGVSISNNPSLLFNEFRQATINAGYPAMRDEYGDQPEGIIACEMTVDRQGRRANTYRAYLEPVLGRPNLHIVSRALTTRIVTQGKRATGVEYVVDGKRQTAHARKEVILSAGAYGSPQLLLLSGIGPAAELESARIKPLHDLPGVGRNLVEHPRLRMSFSAKPQTFVKELRFDKATLSYLRWAAFGTGPFASNVCAANVFLHTDASWNRADVQLLCPALDMAAGIWFPLLKKPVHGLSMLVIMLRQDSRGRVSLRSADPTAAPRIQFNLMQERSDMQRMIRGIRATREIYGQSPLKDIVLQESIPGNALQSDAALEAHIRQACDITHHPVGTCKMGIDEDAVVDPELRVRGMEGLRVADASVMPTIPSGNTNAPSIMIGEKLADLIRGHRLPPSSHHS